MASTSRVLNNSNVCTNSKDGKTVKSKYQDYIHLGSGNCLTPCKILDLDTNGRSSVNQGMEGKVMLSIDFQKWVKRNQERRLYTSLSLLAEVGGYVGIFLGYSFLNFAESLYNFLNLKIKSQIGFRKKTPNSKEVKTLFPNFQFFRFRLHRDIFYFEIIDEFPSLNQNLCVKTYHSFSFRP